MMARRRRSGSSRLQPAADAAAAAAGKPPRGGGTVIGPQINARMKTDDLGAKKTPTLSGAGHLSWLM